MRRDLACTHAVAIRGQIARTPRSRGGSQMKRYVKDLLGIVLSAAIAACGPAAPPPAGPAAVDNGQPKMQATLQALGAAEHELEVAAHNKAGHRIAALGLIRQASAEVQA